jgi:hypothetical protein
MAKDRISVSTGGDEAFRSNFEKIFGTEAERKARHAKEKETKAELDVLVRAANKSAYVGKPFEPFKSPVDGSVVKTKADLAAHNKRNGVTDMREYSDEYFQRRGKEMSKRREGNTEQDRYERRKVVEKTLYKYGLLR